MKNEVKETRIESLKILRETKGNCSFHSCRKCFFGGEKHQCIITAPYKIEEKLLNEKTGKKIKSLYIDIKRAYAELYYNDLIIEQNLDF